VTVWIGTSGWQYADWRGDFYPAGVPQRAWLPHYAARFATVELNASFYRLPTRDAFAGWRERTPDGFVLAVKASRYLTHVRRLQDPAGPVALLLERAGALGPKLGPVLLQLPPTFRAEPARLDATLAAFPAGVRVAVEVRHRSWYRPEVRDLLARHGAALCLAERGERWLTPGWRTADWGYVRFHWGACGPCYGPATLARRAAELARRWGRDDDLYVYFNNDPQGCAVRDAVAFAAAAERAGLRPSRVADLPQEP
jgi:uncharacterized protein YecE (DUF72 family)